MKSITFVPKKIEHCPSCGAENFLIVGELMNEVLTRAGRVKFSIPTEKIALLECESCNLVYKQFVLNDEDEITLHSQWLVMDTSRWSNFSEKSMAAYAKKIKKRFSQFSVSGKKRVLDIGAGEGGYLDYLEGFKKYSIDLNPESFDKNEQRGISTIQCDITSFDFKATGTYDLVTCLDIFEHLRDPQRALHNISSVMVSGGILMISTGNIKSLIPSFLGPQNWWYCMLPEHKVFWSEQSIWRLLDRHGFRVLSISKEVHKGHSILTLRNFKNVIKMILKVGRAQNSTNDKIFLQDHLLVIAEKEK